MAELTLGVVDVGYSDAHAGSAPTTTGFVAEQLEKNYGVMQLFYELRKERIGQFLADSLANALQDRLNGRKTRSSPTYAAEQKIEAEFRAFLDSNELQHLVQAETGAPISAAAAAGVSHRKKAPYAKKNKARAAFVDTGAYRLAFRALFKL